MTSPTSRPSRAGSTFNARGGATRARPQGHRHDTLHMMEGLRNCWCMCGLCWMWQEINGKLFGRCVCNRCPCRNDRETRV